MNAIGQPACEQWAARLGQPVTLHIAVHTGPVVAGSLGDAASAACDVTGDTVNTASRLLGAAPQLLFPCCDGLATLNLDAGNVAMAEGYLAKSQEVCKQAGLEPDVLLILPFLS